MIRINKVRKSFNRHKANEIRAIDNTSVELADTGLVTFLGNSGCGKTTLLNAIGGLDKVDGGDIFINNERLTRRTSGRRDVIRNLNIGYIFQNYNLIEDATVFENVALVLKMVGFKDKKAIERRVMYILERVGIARYRNRPAKMLSGGERQRVGIARAIVKNPSIIIADEPTGNLDSSNTIEVMNIIKAISKEKLVILVTHERDIAEFYADRIIEIVDGRIVEDRENEHEGNLDYRIDTKIYLKDMPFTKDLSRDGFDIRLYSDTQAAPKRINIVIRNNNLYIDAGEQLMLGAEGFEVVDDHYRGLSKEVYEQYKFDYDSYYKDAEHIEGISKGGAPKRPHYRSVYRSFNSLVMGFKKLASYSRLKKILLLGFVLASMFVIYAVSNAAGISHVTDDRFTTTDKSYLSVQGAVSIEKLSAYETLGGVKAVYPGSMNINMYLMLDDYIQSMNLGCGVEGALSDKSNIKETDLVLGRLPEEKDEVVIDNMITRNILTDIRCRNLNIKENEQLIGRRLKVSNDLPEYKIVGISDKKTPCIYTEKGNILSMLQNRGEGYGDTEEPSPEAGSRIKAWSLFSESETIKIVKGDAPEADYEVLVPESMMEQVGIGYNTNVKVDGENLVVSGYYHDEYQGSAFYVNDNTKLKEYIASVKTVTISSDNPESTKAEVESEGKTVINHYENDKASFNAQNRTVLFRTILVAAVMVAISLIEMYLMLRASFLSRIKEVGVLRAIGLKKSDIYRMFAGEVFAITIVTALPGMLFMAYILNSVIKASSYTENMYRMNPAIFGAALLLVLSFNLLAGLMPVFSTLRKTPAEILARNDVN